MNAPRPRGRPRKTPAPTFALPGLGGNSPSVRNSPGRQRWLNAKALADHAPALITMPAVTRVEISDDALGLGGGDAAQERAEQAIRYAARVRLQEAETTVRIEVADDALVLVPALPTDPDERGIVRELRRLAGLPPLSGLED